MKPRRVPFALRPAVEQELAKLEKRGVISPVASSKFATPVVPIIKTDGSVRLCGNYKSR